MILKIINDFNMILNENDYQAFVASIELLSLHCPYGIFLSFCKFTTVTDWKWKGLQNYSRIFFVNGKLDTTFIHSLWYTALFTVVLVLCDHGKPFQPGAGENGQDREGTG